VPRDPKEASLVTLTAVPSLTEDSLFQVNSLAPLEGPQTPLTEFDEKVSPSLALPHWQGHDATDIEILWASLLFAKITHKPRPIVIEFCHHVEQERFDVIEQGLVIEKHF
jgi:hypothetical protein